MSPDTWPIQLNAETYDKIRDRAVKAGMSPRELLEEILTPTAKHPFVAPTPERIIARPTYPFGWVGNMLARKRTACAGGSRCIHAFVWRGTWRCGCVASGNPAEIRKRVA